MSRIRVFHFWDFWDKIRNIILCSHIFISLFHCSLFKVAISRLYTSDLNKYSNYFFPGFINIRRPAEVTDFAYIWRRFQHVTFISSISRVHVLPIVVIIIHPIHANLPTPSNSSTGWLIFLVRSKTVLAHPRIDHHEIVYARGIVTSSHFISALEESFLHASPHLRFGP